MEQIAIMSQISSYLQQNKNPIFIHSLFRAGSTYLFHVFRRSDAGYWCYQEPLHENSFYAKQNYELLLSESDEKSKLLRHPPIGEPYFLELYKVAEHCLPTLRQEAIYDAYFTTEGDNFGIEFWSSLIKESRGRAVIQECRTSSRISGIKSSLNGFHIYLWRNPWDQWWSHKVTDYFDAANQMIINSSNHPEAITRLRQEIEFNSCEIDDIRKRFDWFREHRLTPDHSYLVFYILWFLALQEGHDHADLLLNMDRLSDNLNYRERITEELANRKIDGIGFSDCSIPQAFYTEEDKTSFEKIENRAHGLLLLSGIHQHEIEKILAIRHQYEPKLWNTKKITRIISKGLTRDSERARNLVQQTETREAQWLTRLARTQDERDVLKLQLEETARELYTAKQDIVHKQELLVQKNEVIINQEAHSHWLQNEWDSAKTRLEESSGKLAEKSAILSAREDALTQQQVRSQWLQNEWDSAKTRLEELSGKLTEKSAILSAREDALTQQQVHNQWLQNEWDTAKTRLEELSGKLTEKSAILSAREDALTQEQVHNQWLQNEWDTAKTRLEESSGKLAEKSATVSAREDALTQQQAHSQWLKNEWEAAKVQIDGYKHELEYIYNSRSWKVTLPFRLLLKGERWLVRSSVAFLTFAPESKSRQVLRSLIIQLKRRVNDQPRTKIIILVALKPFPKFKVWLASIGHAQVSMKVPDIPLITSEAEPPKDLSRRARQIYADLRAVVEKNKEPIP